MIVTQSGRVKQDDVEMTECTRRDGDEGEGHHNGNVAVTV